MKNERYAAVLILLAFFSGMVLTAVTSGCDAASRQTAGRVLTNSQPSNSR